MANLNLNHIDSRSQYVTIHSFLEVSRTPMAMHKGSSHALSSVHSGIFAKYQLTLPCHQYTNKTNLQLLRLGWPASNLTFKIQKSQAGLTASPALQSTLQREVP